jgi:fatty-acyl-CoA synthase
MAQSGTNDAGTENRHYLGGIGDWIRYQAQVRGDAEAVVYGDTRLSYQDFDARINRIASVLSEKSVKKGDRVALLLFNCNAFLETFFACAKLGAIAVPLNYRLSPEELEFILNDAQASVIIYHTDFHGLLEPVRPHTDIVHGIAVLDPEAVTEDCCSGDEDYETCLAGVSATEPRTIVAQSDPLMMMYTSGTTGKPKGAILTHTNPTWTAINIQMSELGFTQQDATLTVAPLFHIGGLAIYTLPMLYCGARIVLAAKFDPVELLTQLESERITRFGLLPVMWQALSQVPDFDSYDLSALSVVLCGGSPCPIPVIEFYQRRGFHFLEGFGMTETTATATILNSHDAVRKHGSVGKPLTHVQLRIVDEEDNDVVDGEVGELVLRGPSLFYGYWNRPDASEKAWENGWFHSGDLARKDAEGFYYIVDRKKDMLISGGENVYPTEVENVLFDHPGISDVAVAGVPDDKWGEVPMAFVVPDPDCERVTLEAVQKFCDGRLARFKAPKRLEFLQELPRNATGKVLKRELRKSFSSAP